MKYIVSIIMCILLSCSLVFAQENSPKEVYLKFRKDIHSFKKIEDSYPFLSSDKIKQIREADKKTADAAFAMLQITAEGKVGNVEEKVKGTEALLIVAIQDAGGTVMTGKIALKKENNLWKLDDQKWKFEGDFKEIKPASKAANSK